MITRRRLAGMALIVALAVSVVYAFFYDRTKEYLSEEFLMDTLVSIKTYGNDLDDLKKATEQAFTEMRRIEDLTDRFAEPGTPAYAASDVCRINEQAGKKAVTVSSDVFAMLELSQKYYTLTKGAFDVTIGPVVDVWGFGKPDQKVPGADMLKGALALVNNNDMVLDKQNMTVFLKNDGMCLDLGGIAKGYATQKAAEILEETGIQGALINAGGNIRVLGVKDEKTPWKIGIQDPRDSSRLIGTLDLKEESCVTSGDYNRYFMSEQVRYHHIISPFTGYPAAENMSVTVITQDAAVADILSTALFILSPQEALTLAEELPDTEAFIVTAEKQILFTNGLKNVEVRAGEGYRYDKS